MKTENAEINWHKDTSTGAVPVDRVTLYRGYILAQADMSDYTTGGQFYIHVAE
jgi:hypothetical protein